MLTVKPGLDHNFPIYYTLKIVFFDILFRLLSKLMLTKFINSDLKGRMSPVYFLQQRIVVRESGNFLAFLLRVVKFRLFFAFFRKSTFPFKKIKLFLGNSKDLKISLVV